MKRLAALAAISLALTGCGLRPLYSGGSASPVARSLAAIEVQSMPNRNGWLMSHALADRLHRPEGAPARFRLEIELDDNIQGFGVRADSAVTRERRTLRARYRLVDAARGQVLLDATAGSDAGLDVVGSEYATIAAEQTIEERLVTEVADQIVSRIALYMERTGSDQGGAPANK
ncbi:LPS assembly lipoprotein LptE [Sphingomonas naphthae]|uniref:LPS assembly lipoprotein LptE n=1 Tax=Sphingomonas naphthae TaxID=1813468 RepID=A0ABY7TK57_9SPHN|nr:LPS assembly lipoprotein LptE [Sphingomonas naphthae]WCT73166.1 LPS assembly lipoprotein LptE [Sphingomonas naphthae]